MWCIPVSQQKYFFGFKFFVGLIFWTKVTKVMHGTINRRAYLGFANRTVANRPHFWISMESLSDELLCAILSHIDAWTLSRSVQYVSKRLRRLSLENHLWHSLLSASLSKSSADERLYGHWTEIDWHNEWKWYGQYQDLLTISGEMPLFA
jgi:hypothetical protein